MAAVGIPKSLRVADKSIPLKGPTCRGARKVPSWVHVQCPEPLGQHGTTASPVFCRLQKSLVLVRSTCRNPSQPWGWDSLLSNRLKGNSEQVEGNSNIHSSILDRRLHSRKYSNVYIECMLHLHSGGMAISRTSCTVHSLLFWYQSLLRGRGWFRGLKHFLHFHFFKFDPGWKASRVILQMFNHFLAVSLPSVQMWCSHSSHYSLSEEWAELNATFLTFLQIVVVDVLAKGLCNYKVSLSTHACHRCLGDSTTTKSLGSNRLQY